MKKDNLWQTNLKWPTGGRTVQTIHPSLPFLSWFGWLFILCASAERLTLPSRVYLYHPPEMVLFAGSPLRSHSALHIEVYIPLHAPFHSISFTCPTTVKIHFLRRGITSVLRVPDSLCLAWCLAPEHSWSLWQYKCSEKHYPQCTYYVFILWLFRNKHMIDIMGERGIREDSPQWITILYLKHIMIKLCPKSVEQFLHR